MPTTSTASPSEADALAGVSAGADLFLFAHDLLGLDINPAQERWFSLIQGADENGDPDWLNSLVIHVAANQIGKTLGLGVILLWACWNKVGVPRDDIERWLTAPYQWFHLAPTQQQAYLTYRDIWNIVQGQHPAQRRPVNPVIKAMVTTGKVEQVYDGIYFENGAFIQFRTTDEQGKALQGRRAAGISYDEAAFEAHLKSVVNEVLLMRLVSTGGPLLLVSTPNGINDYFEMVQAIKDDGREIGDRLWQTADGRALVVSHITDNVGFGLSIEVVERMERDLDPATKEQQLRGEFINPAEAFFVPFDTIDASFWDLPAHEDPIPGHAYSIFWDPSASFDATACVVIDCTAKPMRGVHFIHYPKPPAIQQVIYEIKSLHGFYKSAKDEPTGIGSTVITGYDSTSFGGAIIKQMLAGLTPQRPINFAGAGRQKLDLLTNLRGAMSRQQIVFPKAWTRLRREIMDYRLKDEKIQQDCVMAAAGAAEIAIRGFTGVSRAAFSPSGRVTQRAPWR